MYIISDDLMRSVNTDLCHGFEVKSNGKQGNEKRWCLNAIIGSGENNSICLFSSESKYNAMKMQYIILHHPKQNFISIDSLMIELEPDAEIPQFIKEMVEDKKQ